MQTVRVMLRLGLLAGLVFTVSVIAAPRVDVDLDSAMIDAVFRRDAKAVERLLRKGADPNARTPESTPALMIAALQNDFASARVLVMRGADVNARSKAGRTPLLVAAGVDGAFDIVKLLVDKGADLNATDQLSGIPIVPVGGGGATPLIEAAKGRDSRTLRLLLEREAAVNARDKNGASALTVSALYGNRESVRALLDKGADPHATIRGDIAALVFAILRNDAEMVRMLLAAGADVNTKDGSGSTPLMWAAFSERGHTDIATVLLEAGADVQAKNKMGETALVWAKRNGETPLVALLAKAGVPDVPAPRVERPDHQPVAMNIAIERAVGALQKAGAQSMKKAACASCHNHMMPAMVADMARNRGVHVDTKLIEAQTKLMVNMIKPARGILLEGTDVIPDLPVTGGYTLLTMTALGYEPDATTDALARNIAAKQASDGSWIGWAPRPPMESSDIQATAFGIYALRFYAPESVRKDYAGQIARAKAWLRAAQPFSIEEHASKVLGLAWAKADVADVRRAADSLLMKQRADGGWSQLPALESDAYATGRALYALHEAGMVRVSDPSYRRGVEFLLRTQHEDGSWLVKTRAFPFQPLFDGGFPHGRDQWISAAGTAWAAIALMNADEPVRQTRLN